MMMLFLPLLQQGYLKVVSVEPVKKKIYGEKLNYILEMNLEYMSLHGCVYDATLHY